MTLKQYLSIMLIATGLCFVAWGFVIINVDPFQDTGLGLMLFYITAFFTLIGSISLIAFVVLYYFSSARYAIFYDVQRSFLIGLIGSIALTLLLYLQAKAVLNIWNVVVFVFIILFLLLFKLSTLAYSRS